MSAVERYDNGYEEWVHGKANKYGIPYDPWTIREVVFEAPKGTPDGALEHEAAAYLKDQFPQQEVARAWEDEDADDLGAAARVLRVFIQ